MLLDEIKLHNFNVNEIDKISFRDIDFIIKFFKENTCVYSEDSNSNYFYTRFLSAMFYRENCYNCKYACKQRVSDITIGDFWGLQSQKEEFIEEYKGISLVMPNTIKGENFVKQCMQNMVYEKRSVEEAVNGNYQLQYPSKKHKKYDTFMKVYANSNYERACKKTRNLKQVLKDIKIINNTYKKIKGR